MGVAARGGGVDEQALGLLGVEQYLAVQLQRAQLHRRGQLHLEDSDWRKRRYDATAAYCDSKLAVTAYALELDRRLSESGSGVRSVVAHPGIASTNLIFPATA